VEITCLTTDQALCKGWCFVLKLLDLLLAEGKEAQMMKGVNSSSYFPCILIATINSGEVANSHCHMM
jgi:hypothetical protein